MVRDVPLLQLLRPDLGELYSLIALGHCSFSMEPRIRSIKPEACC